VLPGVAISDLTSVHEYSAGSGEYEKKIIFCALLLDENLSWDQFTHFFHISKFVSQGRVAGHYGLRFQEIYEPPPSVLTLKTGEHAVSFHFATIGDATEKEKYTLSPPQ
jgi:hypothetical protein